MTNITDLTTRVDEIFAQALHAEPAGGEGRVFAYFVESSNEARDMATSRFTRHFNDWTHQDTVTPLYLHPAPREQVETEAVGTNGEALLKQASAYLWARNDKDAYPHHALAREIDLYLERARLSPAPT